MSGINKVILIGRLGRDPELRYTPSGVPVANFPMATSEEWKDKNTGEKQERTEWHRIEAWRRLGEICGEYLHKGSQIYIEGRLQTDSFEDREGKRRYMTKIVAQSMQMLDSAPANRSGRREEKGDEYASDQYSVEEPVVPENDDIPF
jgi:single-strand DNA-binding protein